MRKLSLMLLLSFLAINVNAQQAKNHWYIGLDAFKGIPSYVLPNKFVLKNTFIIEPLVRMDVQDSRKSVVFGAGYAKGTTKVISEQIPFQNFRGFYIKASYEVKNLNRPMHIGIGPIISLSDFNGNYRFKGPVFGDYEGSVHEKRIAFGAEGNFSYDVRVSKKIALRLLLRGSVATHPSSNMYIQYFPGIGYNKGIDNILVSGGFATQLYYRIN
ncbi:hypothetical protein [Dyadobacter sp. CY326]|uniref:hypothetical protein n=1 Tax=Dyadobacter sp. CY326 TaxID=2907300 RepID=UPI001F2F38AB|nr:hypothetical protein [Dyadobacter sp. CY326]MCE7068101.1 hypothetical protein [Dyadobacter sp. CY326]